MVAGIIAAIILVGLAVAGIAIKMLVQKDGQYTKTCSTIEFADGEKVGCVCSSNEPEKCAYYELHHDKSEDSHS
jgi:hypothetical protein